jgi:hypothetical protein
MAIHSSNEGHEHEVKWMTINRRLALIGYWVKWEYSPYTIMHRYAIGKAGEKNRWVFTKTKTQRKLWSRCFGLMQHTKEPNNVRCTTEDEVADKRQAMGA